MTTLTKGQPAVHEFETTGDAYDATQCRDDIADGDVLLIASEGVVGIADTWPLAVTVAAGKLHTPGDGMTLERCLNLTFACYWLIAASVSIGVPLSLVHVLVNQ